MTMRSEPLTQSAEPTNLRRLPFTDLHHANELESGWPGLQRESFLNCARSSRPDLKPADDELLPASRPIRF